VRAFKDDNMPEGPQNAPAEEVKAWADHFQRADAKLNARRQSADAFTATHKECLDAESNGQAMNTTLQTLYGDIAFTSGILSKPTRCYAPTMHWTWIRQRSFAKSKKLRTNAPKAQSAQGVAPSEQDLYSMDLEDLHRLDTIENQKRLQEAGERGAGKGNSNV